MILQKNQIGLKSRRNDYQYGIEMTSDRTGLSWNMAYAVHVYIGCVFWSEGDKDKYVGVEEEEKQM